MTVCIMVAVHKPCELPNDDLYLPVQVNATANGHFLLTTDDEGENISHLNSKYSELTALYYGWKNIDADYLGLVHYRRYLSVSKSNDLSGVLTKQQASRLLEEYRIILPKKRCYYIETLYSHYSHTFDERHLIETKNIIRERSPEYISAFEDAMFKRSGYMFNIILAEKQLIDDYCNWLFPILFDLEKRIDDTGMNDFEKRYIGRVAERLFNVWLNYQIKSGKICKNEIKEIPYIYIGKEPIFKKAVALVLAKLFKKKYKQSF